jgi:hypothetical protein
MGIPDQWELAKAVQLVKTKRFASEWEFMEHYGGNYYDWSKRAMKEAIAANLIQDRKEWMGYFADARREAVAVARDKAQRVRQRQLEERKVQRERDNAWSTRRCLETAGKPPMPAPALMSFSDQPLPYIRAQYKFEDLTPEMKLIVKEKLADEQRGVCACCRQPFGDDAPNLDHDHETGRIRGLL